MPGAMALSGDALALQLCAEELIPLSRVVQLLLRRPIHYIVVTAKAVIEESWLAGAPFEEPLNHAEHTCQEPPQATHCGSSCAGKDQAPCDPVLEAVLGTLAPLAPGAWESHRDLARNDPALGPQFPGRGAPQAHVGWRVVPTKWRNSPGGRGWCGAPVAAAGPDDGSASTRRAQNYWAALSATADEDLPEGTPGIEPSPLTSEQREELRPQQMRQRHPPSAKHQQAARRADAQLQPCDPEHGHRQRTRLHSPAEAQDEMYEQSKSPMVGKPPRAGECMQQSGTLGEDPVQWGSQPSEAETCQQARECKRASGDLHSGKREEVHLRDALTAGEVPPDGAGPEQRQPSPTHNGGKQQQRCLQLQQRQPHDVDDDGHQNQSDVAGNTERLKECTEKVQPPQLAGASILQDQAAMPGNDRPDGSSTACKHASAKIDNLRSEIATLAAACSNG